MDKEQIVKEGLPSEMSDNTDTVHIKAVDLEPFPPKLRELAKHMLESDVPLTIVEACSELNLNTDSVYVMMSRCKKDGHDFNELISNQFQNMLRNNKLRVGKRLVEGAVSDSHMDRKLFYELTGDLKKEIDINVNNTLTIGVNTQGIRPSDLDREKGIIDVTPLIPKGK